MKSIAAFPLVALALTACEPYGYGAGPQPYPQGPQGYPDYPDSGYPQGGPPMPPGGPIYPGPGQTVPVPGIGASQTTYRAVGTEPFWDLEIGRELIFTDRGNNVSVSDPNPLPITTPEGRSYRTSRLEVNVVHRQCNDGMSNRNYPDTVDVRVDGRQRYRGCGAPLEYFNQTDESGQPRYSSPQPGYPAPATPYGQPYPAPGSTYGYPPPGEPYAPPAYGVPGAPQGMPVINLSGSNWRVLAINGIRTPNSGFYVNFMPGQLGARFGCNSIGANYTQAGNIISAGGVVATQMACPDMNFENQGMRILQQPLTISGLGERITLVNSRGSIELLRAR